MVETPRSPFQRQTPVQARSAATLEAIFKAALQVLVAEGARDLTTTRVANRAGVSVAALYCYFPDKTALLSALSDRHLVLLAERMEKACAEQHGQPLARMAEAIVQTYWRASFEQPDVTRALYRSITDVEMAPLMATFTRQIESATCSMLMTAPDAEFQNVSLASLTLLTALFGTVRNVFERDLPSTVAHDLQEELTRLCVLYVEAAAGLVARQT